MKSKTHIVTTTLIAGAACVAATSAQALQYDFYGSLRIHAEAVEPDDDATMDSYVGLRDAYSRIGFDVSHKLNDDITAYGKLELPIDSVNLAVQDPWDQNADIRIGKVGVKGQFGDLAYGQMWMPYYNAIAYPVDMFSTYYSGFATYTTFRKGDTVSYYSPTFYGLSAAAAYSEDNGVDDDDRFQARLSYNIGDLTLSAGLDDLRGEDDLKIWGGSLMWQVTDALYVGAKYEQHDSKIDSGYGADGDTAMNFYAGYNIGKHTIKGMIADVDNYGETIYHLGYDYQFKDNLKFFVEYYNEQETAAITTKYGGLAETCWSCDGGQVLAAGLRYDFGATSGEEKSGYDETLGIDYAFYGSLRMHGESVNPDDDAAMDSYIGLRDAYSRIGVKASLPISDDITTYGQLELPIDSVNLAVQDPWDQNADIRIGKVGVKGQFGDLAYGQMWMPYYNAIAYPVDMFSTYYSGFATYTTFRKGDTVSYYSPTFYGLSAAAAYSEDNGVDDDDRFQATLSYNIGDLTLSAGLDDLRGEDDLKIWGGSLMWQVTDALYVGAKYEQHDSKIDSGYGADGDAAMNFYAGYNIGKHTIKGMIADVDNYGETIYHLGYDYRHRDDLKFFAEVYSEEETAAITTKYGGLAETCWSCSGGQVFAVGLRYDFGAP